MGTWGIGLYQDDIALVVRDTYKDQLHRGKTGEEITQELIKNNQEIIKDGDDAPVFWFALADTQWNLGRLEMNVKEEALSRIRDGNNLRRWQEERPKSALKRAKVLADLEQKLLSPQPAEKKISQYKLYRCQWEIGDVYAYPLESEYAKQQGLDGRYFLFHKIGESTCWPGHIIPIVRVKITKDERLPRNVEEFDRFEYVQTSVTRLENTLLPPDGKCFSYGRELDGFQNDEFGFLPKYQLELLNTSKRAIPKNLTFVGNYKIVTLPKLEYVPNNKKNTYGVAWKIFDEAMIKRYCGYNLGQFDFYSK